MKVQYSKVIAMSLIFSMLLMAFSPLVFAEETPGFELPVTVELSGRPPTNDEDYRIVIEADNPTYPMPEGSENRRYTLIITGEDTDRFPRIEFSSIGIYTYTIYQIPGTNSLGTYDNTRYELVVYVTNALDGSGLEITVLLYLLGEEGKLDEVLFENEYRRPTSPPDPPGPEEPDPDPPTPVDPDPDPDPPATPDPQTPEEPVDEIEVIEEEIPEGEPEVPEPVDEIEEVEEEVPEAVPDVPKTGDDTVIWPYIGLFISGAAMFIILGFTRFKKDLED